MEVLFKPNVDVALEFFKRTLGRATTDTASVESAAASLRALSALGNVIVFTFTAARVKQEVAKEGIFPFYRYLASSYEFSSCGFHRLPAHAASHQFYSQKAPAATLAVHWSVTTVMILAAMFGTATGDTFSHLPGYSLLLTANAYGLDIMWFTVIGVAMLILRLWPGSNWRHKSGVPHSLGVLAAVVFTVTNAVPLIAIWVPDPAQPFIARSDGKVRWFAGQTMAVTVLAAGAVYWVGFRGYWWQIKRRFGKVMKMTRSPVFQEGPNGALLLLFEIIRQDWDDYVPKSRTKGDEVELRDAGVLDGNQEGEGGHWRTSTLRQSVATYQ
jgi:hypothetical protein